MLEQVDVPKGGCDPWGAHAGVGLLVGLLIPLGIHTGLWRIAAHGQDPCWRSSWRTVSCGKDTTLEQGKTVRRKEWERQCVTNWLQPLFSLPLHPSAVGGREARSEGEPKKKGGVEGRCFKICFYFSLPYFDFWLAIN